VNWAPGIITGAYRFGRRGFRLRFWIPQRAGRFRGHNTNFHDATLSGRPYFADATHAGLDFDDKNLLWGGATEHLNLLRRPGTSSRFHGLRRTNQTAD
jgi:hypothetical protein